jgi:signal transduction histidine kinase
VLERLRDHQDYLGNLRSRLVHELRTPIMVVRSSLENLAAENDPQRQASYLERVSAGAARLEKIVASMSEASSLESMLAGSGLEDADIAALLRACVEGYGSAFAPRTFVVRSSDARAPAAVVPEAIVQAMDKLVANAVDFASEGSVIELRLDHEPATSARGVRRPAMWRIAVRNQGPALPDVMNQSLFDSMVSVRSDSAKDRAHLGLGLYLVRLIAEFHGGETFANNVPGGVEIGFFVRAQAETHRSGNKARP